MSMSALQLAGLIYAVPAVIVSLVCWIFIIGEGDSFEFGIVLAWGLLWPLWVIRMVARGVFETWEDM